MKLNKSTYQVACEVGVDGFEPPTLPRVARDALNQPEL